MIAVTVEDDATPLVRIFAAKFSTALHHSDYAALVGRTVGVFALKSSKDFSAITVTVERQSIHITSGVKPNCKIVIHLDFNNPEGKPKIEGLLRHPRYAIAVGKLLEFPEIHWADALKRLWEQYKHYPGMPAGITAKSLTEDRQLSVGNMDSPLYVEGESKMLAEAFSGGAPFVQLLADGKLKGNYDYQHIVVLSDVTLQLMLGAQA